jgi:hypothetical protein
LRRQLHLSTGYILRSLGDVERPNIGHPVSRGELHNVSVVNYNPAS